MKVIGFFYYLFSNLIHGNWYSIRRGIIWPEESYKRGMLKRLQCLYKLPYFIETGTYKGDTTRILRSDFEKLWTIELDNVLFEKASIKLNSYPNITVLQGDSSDVLKQIIPALDRPALFWLDGHYSGKGTAKGYSDSPLFEELNIISKSEIAGHVIAIDDISDFCLKDGNMPLSKLLKKLEEMNPQFKFYFDYDILYAVPGENLHREFWRKVAYPIVIR